MPYKKKEDKAAQMRRYRERKTEEAKTAKVALATVKRELQGKPLLQKKYRFAMDSIEGGANAPVQISKPLQRCIAMRVKRYGESEQNAFGTCNGLFRLPGVKDAFANLDIKKITEVWMEEQKMREAYDSAERRARARA